MYIGWTITLQSQYLQLHYAHFKNVIKIQTSEANKAYVLTCILL